MIKLLYPSTDAMLASASADYIANWLMEKAWPQTSKGAPVDHDHVVHMVVHVISPLIRRRNEEGVSLDLDAIASALREKEYDRQAIAPLYAGLRMMILGRARSTQVGWPEVLTKGSTEEFQEWLDIQQKIVLETWTYVHDETATGMTLRFKDAVAGMVVINAALREIESAGQLAQSLPAAMRSVLERGFEEVASLVRHPALGSATRGALSTWINEPRIQSALSACGILRVLDLFDAGGVMAVAPPSCLPHTEVIRKIHRCTERMYESDEAGYLWYVQASHLMAALVRAFWSRQSENPRVFPNTSFWDLYARGGLDAEAIQKLSVDEDLAEGPRAVLQHVLMSMDFSLDKAEKKVPQSRHFFETFGVVQAHALGLVLELQEREEHATRQQAGIEASPFVPDATSALRRCDLLSWLRLANAEVKRVSGKGQWGAGGAARMGFMHFAELFRTWRGPMPANLDAFKHAIATWGAYCACFETETTASMVPYMRTLNGGREEASLLSLQSNAFKEHFAKRGALAVKLIEAIVQRDVTAAA